MKRNILNTLIISICVSIASTQLSIAQQIYKDSTASIEDRIQDLLNIMTIDEKIGQLCFPTGWEMYDKLDNQSVKPSDIFIERTNNMPLGGFWATLRADPWTQKTLITGLTPELSAKALNELQKYVVENTRLGIPLLFAEETMHGHMAIGATVFPTGLSQGSTWNPQLIQKMAEVIALETRVQGAHIGYGPILDLAREPRWSRVEETFGEDPFLISKLGVSVVVGLQGDNVKKNGDIKTGNDDKTSEYIMSGQSIYSTPKHFVSYGIPVGGHNGQHAIIGKRALFSDHLMPFREATKAGVKTIMTSYNSVDGIPATSHKYLLKYILRDKWGFNGFIFSDLQSIEGIAGTHRAAPSIKHAAALALDAGVDADLGGNAYVRNLKQAYIEGLITMENIDTAVANILRLKFEMGLFENPYVEPSKAKQVVRNQKHKDLAREVAREGIVLLNNNNNILPLKDNIGSIAVIGPNADNIYNQLGDYTAPQERENIITVLDGIKNRVSSNTIVRYAKGCNIRDTSESDLDEAVEIANQSDIIVLVIGGSSARDFKTEYIETGAATISDNKLEVLSDMESGEGYDRMTLKLLGDQEELLNKLHETGKPLIVVYIQGRPLNMNNASEKADALLTAWYPGQEGGNAVADIIFGDYNPSGRLSISIPRSVGQLPVYYSLGKQTDYVEGSSAPLYSFGYGLSYTDFVYNDLNINVVGDKIIVNSKVTNTGDIDGSEVVQLYIRDNVSSTYTPPIQLKGFKKTSIRRGETADVEFVLTHDDLALYDIEMNRVTEPGEFTVMIGSASNNIHLRGSFTIE